MKNYRRLILENDPENLTKDEINAIVDRFEEIMKPLDQHFLQIIDQMDHEFGASFESFHLKFDHPLLKFIKHRNAFSESREGLDRSIGFKFGNKIQKE